MKPFCVVCPSTHTQHTLPTSQGWISPIEEQTNKKTQNTPPPKKKIPHSVKPPEKDWPISLKMEKSNKNRTFLFIQDHIGSVSRTTQLGCYPEIFRKPDDCERMAFAESELCSSYHLLEGKCIITQRAHVRAISFIGVFIKWCVYISGATQATNNNNIVEKISSFDV